MAAISVEGLIKRYGSVWALKGVFMSVEEGEVAAVLGPNGAGKTTLLRAIAGILRPTGGKAAVMGVDVRPGDPRIKSLIGYVAEGPSFFPELSVEAGLRIVGSLHGLSGERLRERVDEVISGMGLTQYRGRRYAHLSRGLRRRAEIAAAIIHDPPVLILDEPTLGLDVFSVAALRNIIRGFAERGKAVVIATHNIAEAMSISDKVFILRNGVVIASGPPSELRSLIGAEEALIAKVEGGAEALAEALPSRFRARVEGDTVTLVGPVHECLKALLEAADTVGARIVSVAAKELTWEEVFMRLLEGRKEERGPCQCPLGGGGVLG